MMRHAFHRPLLFLGFLLTACGNRSGSEESRPSGSAAPAASAAPAPAESAAAPAPSAGSGSTAATGQAAPIVLAPPAEGADFIAQAKTLSRVAACSSEGGIPTRLDEKTVAQHCAKLLPAYKKYREGYSATAAAFLATIRPENLPRRVVYPFGGGDLVTALTVFPEAEEITTISLEPPGDVRRVDTIPPERLRGALRITGYGVLKLVGVTYSNTVNLDKGGHASLPGEIVLHLAALVVHGYEVTSLRYFRIDTNGSLHYLSAEEMEAEGTRRNAESEGARAPFANVEIRFKKAGGPEKALRHIAQDLSDRELGKTPGLRAYLDARGPVGVMTKAASHLLWADAFSIIRNYVLDHAVWMVSDSTGVPPRYASAAGFVQETYGVFEGPARYGPVEPLDSAAFKKLFADNPKRPLPMQFGYTDRHHQAHLVVMHKPSPGAPPAPPETAAPVPSAGPAPASAPSAAPAH